MVRLGITEIILCIVCLCLLVLLISGAVAAVLLYQRNSKAKSKLP